MRSIKYIVKISTWPR